MNLIYRLVWSHVTGCWAVAAETARGRGIVASAVVLGACLSLFAVVAGAGPAGGELISGAGSIAQMGNVTTIQQSSPTLSLAWKSFNVTQQESVMFVQPSAKSVAVNRIFDTNGSQILGRINANGQVYLINPNGILFGQGAQVNVGALVASTLDLEDSSLAGNVRVFGGQGVGSIVNRGTINASEGGFIALLGSTVSNQGSIHAPLGMVALGGGSAATLTFKDNSLISMQIDQSVLQSLVDNGGLVKADGGQVIMTAGAKGSLLASVVNNTGVVQARTVNMHEGVITLLAGLAGGTVNVGGTLDASAPSGGNGGFIETSALRLIFSGDMKISTAAVTGKTGHWLIDPVDFTITASGGDITGAALGTLLASNSITVQTAAAGADAVHLAGSKGSKGDINVNDAVNWASNTLTLKADNNININARLSGSGSAKLALEYGQAAVAAGSKSDYVVKAAVDLSPGANFSTRLGSDGALKLYTVITELGTSTSITGTDLQGMRGDMTRNYALGKDIDANSTSAWNTGLGFTSIGTVGAPFLGSLDGLGHTITGVSITPAPATPDVGLIGAAGAGTVIANVGLVGGRVIGGAGAGGLVGSNISGSVNNSYNTGTVTGGAGTGGLIGSNISGVLSNNFTTGNVVGGASTGGLLGSNTVGSISSNYATGKVTGEAGSGGLVGSNTTGNISSSYALGAVKGAAGTGGLLGSNTTGNISKSYATGDVTGAAGTGGLLGGSTAGNVTDSYATGNVTGLASAGGLVSTITTGAISNSYATGNVTGNASSAGLVGTSTGAVSKSYATGNVSGAASSGGLVGTTTGPIDNSYATGIVQAGTASSGQLVGTTTSTVSNSYAAGSSTVSTVGGLVGSSTTGVSTGVTGSYWDITAAPTLTSIGGTSKTTTEMKTPSTFVGWDANIWTLKVGEMPILTALIKTIAVTATADNKTKVYDGQKFSGPYTVSFADPAQALLGFTGLTFSGTSQLATNVGSYSILTSGLTSANKQYVFSYAPGLLNITTAPISISLDGTRAYDGSTNVLANIFTLSGMKAGETLSLAGVGTIADKNVGVNKAVTQGTLALGDGAGGGSGGLASNYVFTGGTMQATITPAPLTVNLSAPGKVYDGNALAAPTLVITNGLVAGETLGVTGTASFNSKDVATAHQITLNSTTLTDASGRASNYRLAAGQTVLGNITPRAITVAATGTDKVYDRLTTASVTVSDDRVIGDTLTINRAANFGDKNVATNKLINITGISLSGTDAGNYIANTTASAVANITPATLVISGITAASKTYDGTTNATLNGAAMVNAITGDTVSVIGNGLGSFATKDAGTAKPVTVTGYTLAGGDAVNYVAAQPAGLSANINAIGLTVVNVANTVANNKVYDGSTLAVLTNGTLVGVLAGDSVTLTQIGTFASKNVGSNIAVTAADTLGGASAGNYSIVQPTGLTANISRLTSVAWVGGATGNWFDPANWAGGAVPDRSNVANIVIPYGVNVSFNNNNLVSHAQGDAVNVDSVGSSGSMRLVAGNLNVMSSLRLAALDQSGGVLGGTGNVALDSFNQTGGSIINSGNFGVSQTFSQTAPGTVGVAGNVDITQLSGDLRFTQLSGNNVTLTARNGAARLGSLTAAGSLDVMARNDITQIAPLNVGSASTLLSTTGDILLSNPANHFGGPIGAWGKNIALTDANAIVLGTVRATGTLDVLARDNITQTGPVTVGAASTLASTAGDIILTNPANDFGGQVNASGKNIALTDVNAVVLGTVRATGTLDVLARDNITQTGPVTVGAASNLASTAGDIILTNPANDFGGQVNASGKNIALADVNAMVLGTVRATGTLDVLARDNITQTAPVTVGGASTLASTVGDIILTNPANDFGGQVNASGKNIALADVNAIVLGTVRATGTLDVLARNDITQIQPVIVNGVTTLQSTAGDILLGNPANDLDGTIIVKARNILLTDITNPTVVLTATGDSTLTAGGNLLVSGITRNLTTTTLAGATILGNTTVQGDLLVNSLGGVGRNGVLAVGGRSVIMEAGVDVSSSYIATGQPAVPVQPAFGVSPASGVGFLSVQAQQPTARLQSSNLLSLDTGATLLAMSQKDAAYDNSATDISGSDPSSNTVSTNDKRRAKTLASRLQIVGNGMRLPVNSLITTN